MELAYLKITKKQQPFLKYFQKKGYTLKSISADNLKGGIEALPSEAVFVPFEVSQDKQRWVEVARIAEENGVRKLFPSSGFIEKSLKGELIESLGEEKSTISEKGFIHLFLYTTEKGIKVIGSGFSPHRKLIHKSPVKLIPKREEKLWVEKIKNILPESTCGFIYVKTECSGKKAKPVELDPIPDISSPTRESILLAQYFGFRYEMVLSLLETHFVTSQT